jgi:hypothetical protein
VYVLGGATDDDVPRVYNARNNTWNALPVPPQPIGSQPGVVQQNVTIISMGGKLDDTAYDATVQGYQALYVQLVP